MPWKTIAGGSPGSGTANGPGTGSSGSSGRTNQPSRGSAAAMPEVAGPSCPGMYARLVVVTAPAENPPATMTSGSMPYSSAWARTHSIAAVASS